MVFADLARLYTHVSMVLKCTIINYLFEGNEHKEMYYKGIQNYFKSF